MTKAQAYTLNTSSLYDLPMTDIIEIIEGLIGIIMDQDKEIELLNGIILNLEDDIK